MPATIISHFDFMTRVYKQGVASAWLTQAHKGRERRSSFRRITMRWKKQVGAQKPATSASYAPARDSACGRFPGMLRGCCGVYIYIYIVKADSHGCKIEETALVFVGKRVWWKDFGTKKMIVNAFGNIFGFCWVYLFEKLSKLILIFITKKIQ